MSRNIFNDRIETEKPLGEGDLPQQKVKGSCEVSEDSWRNLPLTFIPITFLELPFFLNQMLLFLIY